MAKGFLPVTPGEDPLGMDKNQPRPRGSQDSPVPRVDGEAAGFTPVLHISSPLDRGHSSSFPMDTGRMDSVPSLPSCAMVLPPRQTRNPVNCTTCPAIRAPV